MYIGIASPIKVDALKEYLPGLNDKELKLGLGGTAVNLIIKGLLDKGHKVTVFTLDPTVTGFHTIKGEKLKIIIGYFRSSGYTKMFDLCRKEYLQIKEMIEKERDNLDIVNAHWSYEYAIGPILAEIPHLITFRDHSPTILKLNKHPYRLSRLFMDYWVRYKGNGFSFNSEYLKNKIGLSGTVIPNPVDNSLIKSKRSYPDDKEGIDIFFIANGWGDLKNPEAAIAAFAILKKKIKNVRLHLFGKGYGKNDKGFKKVKEEYNIKGIYFHGFTEHDDLMTIIEDFDIHLHTAREESFGNTLVEAMGNGIPVVAGKDSGAVPWVLNGGKAGMLVDINNPQKIAEALEQLLTQKDLYEIFSEKGIINTKERFALDVVTDKYISEYKSQIQKQNS